MFSKPNNLTAKSLEETYKLLCYENGLGSDDGRKKALVITKHSKDQSCNNILDMCILFLCVISFIVWEWLQSETLFQPIQALKRLKVEIILLKTRGVSGNRCSLKNYVDPSTIQDESVDHTNLDRFHFLSIFLMSSFFRTRNPSI